MVRAQHSSSRVKLRVLLCLETWPRSDVANMQLLAVFQQEESNTPDAISAFNIVRLCPTLSTHSSYKVLRDQNTMWIGDESFICSGNARHIVPLLLDSIHTRARSQYFLAFDGLCEHSCRCGEEARRSPRERALGDFWIIIHDYHLLEYGTWCSNPQCGISSGWESRW